MRIRPRFRQTCPLYLLSALLLCRADAAPAQEVGANPGADAWLDNFRPKADSRISLRPSVPYESANSRRYRPGGEGAGEPFERASRDALRGPATEEVPSVSASPLRRAFVEWDEQEFTLRGRLMYVAALPSTSQKTSLGTGLGGEISLDWRATENFGPYVALTYAGVAGIAANPSKISNGVYNNATTISHSNVNSITSYTIALLTVGLFADVAPFSVRGSVGVGYGGINSSYNSLTRTQLLFDNGSATQLSSGGKQLAPARSWSLAGTLGLELDLVKALTMIGWRGVLPRGVSARIGVEAIAGNAFLRPADSGTPKGRGALGFLALTGGASYAFPVSAPWIFPATRVTLPPSVRPAS
jgi:hypothetical protein